MTDTETETNPADILRQALDETPGFSLGAAAVMSRDEIRDAYNGCGPERWPRAVRSALDSMTSLFAPAVIVHDCDFALSDATDSGLEDATRRFRANADAILASRYPLLSWSILLPSYRAARRRAAIVHAALCLAVSPAFCRDAWLDAAQARSLALRAEAIAPEDA